MSHDHSPHDHRHSQGPDAQSSTNATAKDPVCGMTVDPAKTTHHTTHDGHEFHFCSAGCRAKFVADPAKYLTPAAPEPVKPGVIYTCPMHPEVRQIGPGACPKCGMALEPEDATAGAGQPGVSQAFIRRTPRDPGATG